MPSLKRTASGGYASRARIPQDVRDDYAARFGQRHEAKFSAPAGTPDADARKRYGEWLTEFQTRLEAIRAERTGQGSPLTFKQAHGLAGDWYRWFVGRHEDNPGPVERWEDARDAVHDVLKEEAPFEYESDRDWPADAIAAALPIVADQAETQTFLASKGVVLNAEAQGRFLRALFDVYPNALRRLIACAGGRFTEDAYAASLPRPRTRDTGETPWQLFETWVAERQPAPSTVETWRYMFRNVTDHFAERSAGSITEDEAREWLRGLVTPERSARTVGKNWLRAMHTVFAWAKEHKRIPQNPFAGARVTRPKKATTRDKWFSDDEVTTLLRAALAITDTTAPIDAAKRWVPWLLAYTGARPGEIAQLRGVDVVEEGGVAALHLTPEAGTIKEGRAKTVPLHEHVIEQGFVAWARERGAGPLFFKPRVTREARSATEPKKSPAAQVRQRLATWVRESGVTDKHVSPNHGWRHTFKHVGDRAGIPERMLDEICGHAPASVGRTYARPTLADKAEAMRRFPRYQVE